MTEKSNKKCFLFLSPLLWLSVFLCNANKIRSCEKGILAFVISFAFIAIYCSLIGHTLVAPQPLTHHMLII